MSLNETVARRLFSMKIEGLEMAQLKWDSQIGTYLETSELWSEEDLYCLYKTDNNQGKISKIIDQWDRIESSQILPH
jgi:hypothetical protein